MSVTILQGDARTVLQTLEAGSIHTCITSPPYYNLRDYGTALWEGGDATCEHLKPLEAPRSGRAQHLVEGNRRNEFGGPTDLAQTDGRRRYRGACARCGAQRTDAQIGAEATPAAYVAHLVAVFRGVWRVLRDDGTLWLVLGDSYASSGVAGTLGRPALDRHAGKGVNPKGSTYAYGRAPTPGGFKAKDLMMIPHRVALALQDDGWYVRNDCVWAKGSAMPESVRDRFSRAHEYVFHLAKSEHYYFDAIAVAEPISAASLARIGQPTFRTQRGGVKDYRNGTNPNRSARHALEEFAAHTTGTRNRRSVLHVNPQPFSAADYGVKDIDHYAVFPEKLVDILTLCSTSEAGCCPRCGAPYRRAVERMDVAKDRPTGQPWAAGIATQDNWASGTPTHSGLRNDHYRVAQARGWAAGCSCDAGPPIGCTTLDPFLGSGTTALVSKRLGRSCIGIELNPAYAEMARRRVESVPYSLFSGAASTGGAAR